MSSITLIAVYKFLATQSMCHSMFSLILSDWLISKTKCAFFNNTFWVLRYIFCEFCPNAFDGDRFTRYTRYLYFGSIFFLLWFHFFFFFIFCRRNSNSHVIHKNQLLTCRSKIFRFRLFHFPIFSLSLFHSSFAHSVSLSLPLYLFL